MDVLTAKYLLCELWSLIETARDRDLCEDRTKEVERICQEIGDGRVSERDAFNHRAEGLPLFVFSSGACDSRQPQAIRKVLDELTALRKLL
jgi:hypothetical protein